MTQDFPQPAAPGLVHSLGAHFDAHFAAPAVFVVDPSNGFHLLHASESCKPYGLEIARPAVLLTECLPALSVADLERLWIETGCAGMSSAVIGIDGSDSKRINVRIDFSLMTHEDRHLMAGFIRTITSGSRGGVDVGLQTSLPLFSRMAEYLPGFVYTFRKSPDGHAGFPYVSTGIQDVYGLRPEDVIDDVAPMMAVTHPEDLPAVLEAIQKSVAQRTPFNMEFRVRHPGKGIRWVESKARPDRGLDGSILFHGMMLDVTPRKRIENILKFIARRGWDSGRETFLTGLARFLAEELEVDYVLIDKIGDDPASAETVAIFARGQVLPNMQYSLKGTPCENVLEGSLCSYPSGICERFPEDHLLVDMQAESYVGQPLWDSTGKVIGLIAVLDSRPMADADFIESVLRLVSTRVAAELERGLSELALRASREFLQQVVDTLPEPVFAKDRQHRWLLLNQAFVNLSGIPAQDLLGKSDYDVFPAAQAAVFWEKDEMVFAEGGENVNEETLTDAQGHVHTILTRKRCFTDKDGQNILVGSIHDVTQLKQSQRRLEETGNRLRSVLQTTPDYLWLKDIHGVYLGCNPAAERLIGIAESALIGTTDYDYFERSQADAFREKDREAIAAGAVCINEEWVTLAAEQRRILLETRKMPVYGTDGEVIGILGIGRDITERKRFESTMAAREREFRSLAENLPDNIARWDCEGRILVTNPTHQRTLGKPAAELIGKTHLEAFPDDRYRPVDEAIAQVVATGEPIVFVRQNVFDEHGEERTHDIKLVPERDEEGRVVSVLGIGRDMTDIYRMQEAVAAREQEFRSLAENLPDNVGRWDAAGRYIYINPVYERTLRTRPEFVLGKTIAEAFPERADSPVAHAIAQVLATGDVVVSVRQIVPGEHGEMRMHDVNLMPEKNAEGQVIGILGIGRDMTEYYRMQEAIVAREQEFRTLAENAPEMIVRYDTACRRIYVNPAYVQISGKARDNLIERLPSSYWYPENISADDYMALLRDVMTTGKSAETLLEWKGEQGQLVSHLLHLAAEYDINGDVSGVLAIGHDVSARRKAEKLAAIRMSIFEELAKGGEIGSVLEFVARFVESSNNTLLCSIMLFDSETGRLHIAAAPSLPTSFNTAVDDFLVAPEGCNFSVAAWRGETMLVKDLGSDPGWADYHAIAAQSGLAACWAFPICDATGGLLGVFTLFRNTPGLPAQDDMALVREASHLAVISIERKRGEEKLKWQASYDILTGLPNRRLFSQRLKEDIYRADRHGHPLGLLFIDLDRFKEVNDTMGHDVGDNLLVEAANRIQQCVRESDSVSRLGGDEFVVIVPDFDELTHLGRVAQDIIDALTQVFLLEDHAVYVSASIGIACYPEDSRNMDNLLGCADQAMYAAKEQGRNGFRYFTAAMQQQAQQRMQLATDLRDALAQQQLHVHYQPIIEIASGQIVKAEALIRWQHPQLGAVRPDHFIPIAEETGLIHQLGEWVFLEAMNTMQNWRERVGQNNMAALKGMSVNISPRQFMRGDFAETWIKALQAEQLPADAVVIEITEGLLLGDQADILDKLERFREAGMSIALDDFGTGYSAMGYLKKFPIDYLKIDRSFVRDIETDPNDRAIAEAIVVMAHKLGLKVIAEGVETEGQRDILAAVGCEYVQGYLYAKPMPEEAFLGYVVSHSTAHALLTAG